MLRDAGGAIIIRDLDTIAEMRDVELLQKEVWGIGDLDVVPLTHLVAARHCGGILIGAFDQDIMVGFAYGFVSQEDGHTGIHSHMLAVKREYRNRDLGYRLKLEQRERALAAGLSRITWTFDPLQSLNAHFNFGKLGVLSDQYKENFYGEETSSFLHRIGTDRLWVTWLIASRRVAERIENGGDVDAGETRISQAASLIEVSETNTPIKCDPTAALSREHAVIQIPSDINSIQRESPQVAIEWREATRWAFGHGVRAGYLVEDFYRVAKGPLRIGAYLLSRNRRLASFS